MMNFTDFYNKNRVDLIIGFTNEHPEDYQTDDSFSDVEVDIRFDTYVRDSYMKYYNDNIVG